MSIQIEETLSGIGTTTFTVSYHGQPLATLEPPGV